MPSSILPFGCAGFDSNASGSQDENNLIEPFTPHARFSPFGHVIASDLPSVLVNLILSVPTSSTETFCAANDWLDCRFLMTPSTVAWFAASPYVNEMPSITIVPKRVPPVEPVVYEFVAEPLCLSS